ncbi:MAG TPA: hypothetical protein VFN67_04035, partial [Polyangiales bacterium]|nr:hypothetical protein [Polyangiales bacterium]
RSAESLDVFWIDRDGTVWSRRYEGTPGKERWLRSRPISPARAAAKDSRLTAVANGPERLDVFWVGADQEIWRQWWEARDGESWDRRRAQSVAPKRAVALGSSVAAVRRAPDKLDLFWVGSDGAIARQWWEASEGERRGPVAVTTDNVAIAGSQLTAISRDRDQLDVFWVEPLGTIQQWSLVSFEQGGSRANKPAQLTPFPVAAAGSQITAISRETDQIEIFWVGNAGAIKMNWWKAGGTWRGPLPIRSDRKPAPGTSISAVARVDESVDLFWVTHDGAIAWQWADGAAGEGWSSHESALFTPEVAE